MVHAIGDASEITQNSTDKKLRMVEKETDCRLKHLQVNVERLKSILLTSDLGRLPKLPVCSTNFFLHMERHLVGNILKTLFS